MTEQEANKEQRRHRRASLAWPVTIETGSGLLRGRTVDVSEGGLLVAVDAPLPQDRPLRMAIEVDEMAHVILTQGEIVRHVPTGSQQQKPYNYGLRFTDLSDKDRRCFTGNLAPEWRRQPDPAPAEIQSPTRQEHEQEQQQHDHASETPLEAETPHVSLPPRVDTPAASGGAPKALGDMAISRETLPPPPAQKKTRRFRLTYLLAALVLLALFSGWFAWSWQHYHASIPAQPDKAPATTKRDIPPPPKPLEFPDDAALQPGMVIHPLLVLPGQPAPERQAPPQKGTQRNP